MDGLHTAMPRTERARLRKIAREADSAEERRDARRELAAGDRERHRDIYEKLADE